MRLLRLGQPGQEIPVVGLDVDDARVHLDVSSLLDDFSPEHLAPARLDALEAKVRSCLSALPVVLLEGARLAPPVAGIGKIVCVGLNYRRHAAEAGMAVPDEPVLFMKAADTVVGANDDVVVPRASRKTDYEVELAVVIGSRAADLDEHESALAHVAGYAISNDVSEREYQLERGGQWDKGKNCATFNPLGPWVTTTRDIPDPQILRLRSTVNGEVRQDSSTADMIFTVDYLVRYISRFMTLYPGDVINTGTPEGVGAGFDPPRFVSAGDVVELAIDGLGMQRQDFVAWTREAVA